MNNTEHLYVRKGENIAILRQNEEVGIIKSPMAKARINDLLTSLGNSVVPKQDK